MAKTILHIYHTARGELRIVAWTKGRPRVGQQALWDGPTRIVTNRPMRKSGATTWIETRAKVKVIR